MSQQTKTLGRVNRAPGQIWMFRRPAVKVGQTNGSVRTLPEDYIGIGVWGDYKVGPQSLVLSRKDARMLVKRIAECLDETTAQR